MSQTIGPIETVPVTAKYDAILRLSDHLVQGLLHLREVDARTIPGNPSWNYIYARNQISGRLYTANDDDGNYGNSHIGHGAALRLLRLGGADADTARLLDYAAEYTLELEKAAVALYGPSFSGAFVYWAATYPISQTDGGVAMDYAVGQPRRAFSSDQGHMGAHWIYAYLHLLRDLPDTVVSRRAAMLDLTRRAAVREATRPVGLEAPPGYGAGPTNLFGNLLRLLTGGAEGAARNNGLKNTAPFYGTEYTAWKINQQASRTANASSNSTIDTWMQGLVAPDSTQGGMIAFMTGASHDMLAMDLGRQNVTYAPGMFTRAGAPTGAYPNGWSVPAGVTDNLFQYDAADTPPDTVRLGSGGARDGLNGRASQRAIVLAITALYDPDATIHINETGSTVNVVDALEDMMHTVALYGMHNGNGLIRYSYPGYLGKTSTFDPDVTDPAFSGYALMACELYLLVKQRATGTVNAADDYRWDNKGGALTLSAASTVPAVPFPATLSAADYTLSSAVTPTVNADGTLTFSSNTSSQPAALLRNARLADGQSFSAAFTVDNPDGIRIGFLLAPTGALPVPDNGLWFAVEGGAGTNTLRVLRWNQGTFNYDAGTVLAPCPALIANQSYTLSISRLGDTFTVSLDGVASLAYTQSQSHVGEEPLIGIQVGFRSRQRTYRVRPLPTGAQASSATVSSAVPDGAEVMLRRAGRPGYSLGTLGTQTLPASSFARELVPFIRDGPQLRAAGPALLVPAGTGVNAASTGTATPGAVLGFSEPATDAAMPLWDGVTLAGKFSTTVNPATRAVIMTPLDGSGYAYRSRTSFDPAQDMTAEFYATYEQLIGVKGFLGVVFHVTEEPGNYNYGGLNVNRDLAFPTGGLLRAALYGNEAFNQAGVITVDVGREYLHRVVYDAAGKRLLWWMDDVFQIATPWEARGPVHLWIGSVSQDTAPATPGKQSRATFRDVRFLGTPCAPT